MDENFDDELPPNGIAVIGMACRMPGANGPAELWQSVSSGREEITRFSKEELLAAGHDRELVEHPDYVPMNRVVAGADAFDASFFGFTPREAEVLDPQQRLFLECAHEALESAGYGAREQRGPVGVFAGATLSSHLLTNLLPNAELLRKQGPFPLFLSNDKDFLPTRVSYKLDLRGPSVNVQTACSTSLVAVHMACQALLESECDLALAGGSSIRVPERAGYLYQKDMIFSPDGRSYAFDARARGTVAGSGVGVVVLKRLDDALADGDPILAVIRGSAINNDGAGKVGFTAPSVEGQARVIREALAVAGVSADSISYVEAHGTATPLGDPIEIAALTRVFRADTQRKGFCALGTLKSNVGHMDAAAGVGGLIKTILMLQHGKLTPSPNFERPNPQIDLANSPFFVSTRLEEWRASGAPRRAGVSSFGIGGTNAHVILEEAPAAEPVEAAPSWQLLTLSAKTEGALRAACARLADHLEASDAESLADVAYTLHVGREPLAFRRAVVCHGRDDAIAALRREEGAPLEAAASRPAVFLFPGGGAQYPRMGRDLYQDNATFRESFDRCAGIARRLLGLDLPQILFAEVEANEHASRLQRPLGGLSCLFAVEYALASVLLSWGVQPAAMLGHSLGEYVAACLAGVFSLEDALLLVTRRGQLFEALPAGGAMISVPLSERELAPLLDEGLSIAAINGPSACTVSGASANVERLVARLGQQGILAKPVPVEVAAHSPLVEPALPAFRKALGAVAFSPPRIPIISSRTGTWLTDAQATDPAYWVEHLRHTVRFSDGLATLLAEPAHAFLEVGPGNTLASLARQHPSYRDQPVISAMRHSRVHQPDDMVLLGALGASWACGGRVDWSGFHAHDKRRRVPLPTYPFERQRFWVDPPARGEKAAPLPADAPSRHDLADWFYVPGWRRSAPLADEVFTTRRIVLFADGEGLGDALAEALRRDRHEVVVVRRGTGFARLGPREFALDPARPEEYPALCRTLTEGSFTPELVVHACSVAQASQALGLHSLLFLTQALEQQGWLGKTRITALTSGVHRVTGEEASTPENATLLGWLRTMPFEFPGTPCQVVDVAVPPRGAAREALAAELCLEVSSNRSDAVVAYRGRQRWVPTHESLRLPGTEPARGLLRERGVYLITGGLGGVGLALAAALAERAPVRLVLLGRSALPPRSEWERLAADERTGAPLREQLLRVLAIERLGAEVLPLAADVCDRAAMVAALAAARERFGAIHGVIHAAGLPGGASMLRQTPELLARTLAPKVEGTRLLWELLSGEPLDFMALCSALVTVVGAFGNLDYTAANAFLDAFAQARAGEGSPVVSIAWNRWQHLGMARAVEALHEARTGEALEGMAEAQGREVFLRILQSRALARGALPQVAVSSDDLEHLVRAVQALMHAQPARPAAPARIASHARPALRTAFSPPTTPTENRLAALLGELLGIDGVGIDDNFFELGGDSLVGTRLVAHMREVFPVDLSLRDLFEAPTVAGLAQRIDTSTLVRSLQAAPTSAPADGDDMDVGTL